MSPLVGSCWDFVLISDRGLLVKVLDTAPFSKRYKNFFMTSDRGLLVMSRKLDIKKFLSSAYWSKNKKFLPSVSW
jgi:hypothetical protein